MIHRRSLLLLACAAAALLVRCSPTQTAGGGSGSEVVGFLVDGKGNRVAGATVVADTAQVQKDSTSILDTAGLHRADTLSDATGRFVLHHLDTTGGVYNIRCSYNKGALVALIPDVKVVTFDTDLGVDTMYPPGSISGKVVLSGGPDAGVFCYVPGTSFIAMSNDTGGFTIYNVPKGVYKIYFYFPGYLVAVDSQVIVVTGQITSLGVKVMSLDPTGAPPPPAGLSATVDTANGIVRLSWDSVRVSDLVGYRVYRKDSTDTGYSVVGSSAPGTDTFFVDTVYKNSQDSLVHDYSYVVKAFDVETNASAFSNLVSVRTVPPWYVRTVFWLTMQGLASDTANAGDTVRIAARFSSVLTKTDTVTWFTGAPGSVLLRRTAFGAKQGYDTLSYAWTASGPKEVYIQALDERGMVWLDSIHLVVRPRAVDVVTVRSTDSSCTVLWRASAEPAFAKYRLLVADTAAAAATIVADSITSMQDTAFTMVTWKNGPKKYTVLVVALNGLVSNPGKAAIGAIVNTPPRFLTDTSTIPKTANVGTTYVVKLSVVDVNKDSLRFSQLSQITGLSISDSTLSWTPTVLDTGAHAISVQVSDGFGGMGTLSWKVTVVPTNVWAYVDSLSRARRLPSAVMVNGIIYAIGGAATINPGAGATLVPLSTVETYVAASNGPWTTLAASLPSARYWNAIAPANNAIYSFGGVSERGYFQVVDSFGISGGRWDSAGQLPVYRYNAAACAVGDTIYLIGGLVYSGPSQGFTVTNEIDAWDPSTGTLSMRASMMIERSDHQAVALNGKIYIIGGLGGSPTQGDCAPQTSVEVYDPSTNFVVPGPSLTTARLSFGAAAANGKIYAIGGLDQNDTAVSSVEELDPVQNTSTYRQKLPKPRYGCAAVSSGDRIYVIGGVEGGTETNSVLVFYP